MDWARSCWPERIARRIAEEEIRAPPISTGGAERTTTSLSFAQSRTNARSPSRPRPNRESKPRTIPRTPIPSRKTRSQNSPAGVSLTRSSKGSSTTWSIPY
ncbi:MAG: hypothetical protein MUE73_22140, partial [Planctomycetes bacterium]|nr:hypothetical protein [Planctomycetota bacterium]